MKIFVIFILCLPLYVDAQIINTIAGKGVLGYNGDGGPASAAKLHLPGKVIVDADGNLYIADTWGQRVRKVDILTGIITTVAGTGTAGYNGDGIAATSAQLNDPVGLAFDTLGNLYIADGINNRIRMLDFGTGIISTIAGNGYISGSLGGFSGDGGPATNAELNEPGYIAFDKYDDLYISDCRNYRIRKVNISTDIITTYAGNGISGYSGDGSMATSAELLGPEGIAFDNFGNLYIADSLFGVRKIETITWVITTAAGDSTYGYSGDGLPATSAEIQAPFDVAFDGVGNYYIAEFDGRVRKVDTFGIIHTVAGTTIYGYNGDGIPATSAELNETTCIALDACGNLYIADAGNERIRKVTFDTSCNPTALAVNKIAANSTISIYPNPAHDEVTITDDGGISQVTICNLVGQVVYSQVYDIEKAEVNVSGLPVGVYVVRVTGMDGKETIKKFVKE